MKKTSLITLSSLCLAFTLAGCENFEQAAEGTGEGAAVTTAPGPALGQVRGEKSAPPAREADDYLRPRDELPEAEVDDTRRVSPSQIEEDYEDYRDQEDENPLEDSY